MRGPDGFTVEERWTSVGLKPYFNDFVVHEGPVLIGDLLFVRNDREMVAFRLPIAVSSTEATAAAGG